MFYKSTFSTLKYCVAGFLFAAAFSSATACESEADQECKAKFKSMVGPCVPVCEQENASGTASDACIRACVAASHDEPIPRC